MLDAEGKVLAGARPGNSVDLMNVDTYMALRPPPDLFWFSTNMHSGRSSVLYDSTVAKGKSSMN